MPITDLESDWVVGGQMANEEMLQVVGGLSRLVEQAIAQRQTAPPSAASLPARGHYCFQCVLAFWKTCFGTAPGCDVAIWLGE